MYQDIDIIVSTTLPTLDVLSTYKNGWDAILLYFRYVRQARLQKTNTTYSKDTFMANGLEWSLGKFYKVKKILSENKLIETITRKGEDWKIEGTYVQVNFLIKTKEREGSEQEGLWKAKTSTLSKNHTTEKPESGKMTSNAWSNINKTALNNKYKYGDVVYEKAKAIEYIYETYKKGLPLDKKKYTKKGDSLLQIEQLFSEYSMDELMNAQTQYFKTQSITYLMACQYFYSNKKNWKTYRPFIDYITETEERVERKSIDFNKLI